MNAIQKYIRKKRFEKYLKLKQEFGYIKQPKVYVVERDIKKLIADRGFDISCLPESEWSNMIDHCKSKLAYEFAKSLIPYMTIEVFDSEIRPFTKVVRGTLYVALERGKNHGKYLQRG